MFEVTPLWQALETSSFADWVGGPIYPVVSAAHILAFAFVLAPILIADSRVLYLGAEDNQISPLSQIAVFGFLAAALTGLLLFSVQATRYTTNPALTWKLALIAIAGINAICFRIFPKARKAIALTSIVSWLGVLLSGRWIAFAA